ncbi:MAG TPA: hypothetical protein ENJ28_12215 [Gammaproteobacteria bacterium]|nr:hypothetical protein [Gammaproteobacteria bacterium]
MKNISIILFFYYVHIVGLPAQNNNLIFRASHFFSRQATEEVETEDADLIVAPSENDKVLNINFDLAYARKKNKTEWYLRLGYSRTKSVDKLTTVGADTYINSDRINESEAWRIGTGLYYPVFTTEDQKASIDFGSGIGFSHRYLNKLNFSSSVFNEQGEYLGGSEREIDFSNSWSADITLSVLFKYYFVKGIGIGIENNLLIYLNRLKGVTKQERKVFDENLNVVDQMSSRHNETQTIITNSFPISINIFYRF